MPEGLKKSVEEKRPETQHSMTQKAMLWEVWTQQAQPPLHSPEHRTEQQPYLPKSTPLLGGSANPRGRLGRRGKKSPPSSSIPLPKRTLAVSRLPYPNPHREGASHKKQQGENQKYSPQGNVLPPWTDLGNNPREGHQASPSPRDPIAIIILLSRENFSERLRRRRKFPV